MTFIEDEDQLLSKASSDWSQRTVSDQGTKVIWRITQARMLINVRLISSGLEGLQESLYFYSYKFLRKFCQVDWIKSHP